jgi:hypothetical protein
MHLDNLFTDNLLPYILEIERGDVHFHVLESKLFPAIQYVAVERDAGAAVEVESTAIASAQVTKHVTTAGFEGGRLDEVYGHVGLTQLKVRTASFQAERTIQNEHLMIHFLIAQYAR